jgi:hypothetical protein
MSSPSYPRKKYYIHLRLTQSEIDQIERLGLTPTQATHQSIEYWQSLTDIDRELATTSRKHLAIDTPMLDRTIGANKSTKLWMDSIDNKSLTASTAIGVWLNRFEIQPAELGHGQRNPTVTHTQVVEF